jgi:hypothetical protein
VMIVMSANKFIKLNRVRTIKNILLLTILRKLIMIIFC